MGFVPTVDATNRAGRWGRLHSSPLPRPETGPLKLKGGFVVNGG